MGSIEIIDREGEMELVVAQVIGAVPIAQPGQLEAVAGHAVAQKDDREGAIRGILAAHLGETECLAVKGERALEIEHIDIVVVEAKLHKKPSFAC